MAVAGFIGLGNIGGPMARRLLANPDGLVVFDVRPESYEKLVAKGATAAADVADVARTADVISVVVRDDDQVRDVTTELLAASRPGLVIAIHSTIKASTAIALAEVAEPLGVHIVDAPISGGAMGAHAGTLAVMVGGEADAVELCRPVFGHFASLVSHLGPVGSGTRAKLARNLLHFVAFTAVGEAQRLAEAAGIPVAELGKIVRHSDSVTGGPGAIMLRDSAGPLAPGDDWYPVMENVASLGAKDLQQALELAAELGVDTPLASMALQRLALELGLPEGSGT
ncbi:MAG TPA: NAD(P)-dependent oxidoreductase [Microthrixaceae bacterium]|jgi:2-hydroxy-3-oxopropionate reductase|nr:NAD(P)-dependent oxidoreductase [Microthrixaceae bacterium]HQF94357.1 NAD(P)-dependent oxidoreductase [Microthrixaceae bacterium]